MKKIITILLGIFLLSGCSFQPKVITKQNLPIQQSQISEIMLGSDSGALSPQTMADDATVGTAAWASPDNAKVSDDAYASIYNSLASYYDSEVKIVKADGTIGGTNKAFTATQWLLTEGYISYGGETDLWGETWDNAKINDVDFGVVLSVKIVGAGAAYSHYLKATNFGFSIPAGATINGILVEIEKKEIYDGGLREYSPALVDHIRITVFFTESATNSCSYSGVGNWDVLGSDACYITSNVYVNGEFNLIGGSFGCADGVKISATKFNFGAPTEMESGCMAWHQ